MKKLFLILFFLSVCSLAIAGDYIDVKQDTALKFPQDLYYRPDYKVQWWYFTGHLFDAGGSEFGYELTFFTISVQQRDFKSRFGVNRIYISHFAVSDVAGRRFFFSDKADTGAYDFAGAKNNQLDVWLGENMLYGTTGKMHIKASDRDRSIDLRLTPVKSVVLNGEKGYSRKSEESPLIASLYFSYTNLETEGEVKVRNKVFKVTGKSWFDREISSRGLGENQAGWDWFAVQLDDRREMMLYLLRNKDGSIDRFSSGTFVYPDGGYRHLQANDFVVSVLSHYKSPHTGARYPSGWEIKIPSERLVMRIIPLLEDQEVLAYNSTGNYYWEGTCKVEGAAKGRAYVEMTGY